MGEKNLKNKTVKGLLWSGIDKFSYELIQFTVGIIMARLLMPSDYGVVGIIMVFVSFSTLFIEGGLTTALIQKSNRTEDDFNTAFVYNLGMAIFIYIVLFFSAPFIANVYKNPDIEPLLRVITLNLIISSFSTVQNTRLTINLDFKKISIVSVSASLLSGIVGILMAYNGFGVWALVSQQITINILRTILLYVVSHWHPLFRFSKKSFKELFGFSSRLILTNLLARVYDNLYPLIIGKLYPFKTLGYYTRAHQYSALPVNIMRDMFNRVSFPVLSSIKEDIDRLRRMYRIYIEMSSAVIFPVMFILIVVSKPLILLMLTEKWEPTVPFMQILCLGGMFSHISAINLNLLYVKGRSDLALKLEVLKKLVAISILVVSTFWGIWGICIGQAVYSVVAVLLNSKYTNRLIFLSFVQQIKDFGGVWLLAALSAIVPYIVMGFVDDNVIQIVVAALLYVLIYVVIHFVLKTHSFELCRDIVNKQLKRRYNNSEQ